MNERFPDQHQQHASDFLGEQHKEALGVLSKGLLAIRACAFTDPNRAMDIAIALHNIPDVLSGENRAGPDYLESLIWKANEILS